MTGLGDRQAWGPASLQRGTLCPKGATAGVTSTGNQTVDAAMQLAAVQHLQGWFATSTARYADAAQLAPTNADAFLGAALSFRESRRTLTFGPRTPGSAPPSTCASSM